MNLKYICINIAFLVAITGFMACKQEQAPAAEEAKASAVVPDEITLTKAQLDNAKLGYTKLEEKMLPIEIKLNGRVFTPASEKISVHLPLAGYVKSLPWIQGMAVKKGQVLAVAEDVAYLQLQQDYLQAISSLELAETEWNRQKQLLGTKATSEKLSLEARNNYQRQNIETAALKQKLKLLHIDPATLSVDKLSSTIKLISPVNGYVQRVSSNLGDYVNPQDEILTLIATNDVMVLLNAFEKDLMGLKIGQQVNITTSGSPNQSYPATVTQLGKAVGGQGTLEVVCKLKGYSGLIEGQYVSGQLTLQSGMAYCVPEKSVVHYEGKEYVFIQMDELKYAMVEVKSGSRNNDWVQVVNTKDLMDRPIVTEGSYTLLMSLKNVEE